MKLLQSSWVIALIGSLTFLGTMFVLFPKQGMPQPRPMAAPQVEQIDKKAFSIEGQNQEVDDLIRELQTGRTELAERSKQLKELEERLRGERGEINQATQRVFQLQKQVDQTVQDFEKTVVRVKEEEVANLKRQAKMYASMAPENATPILKEMTDEQLAKLLVFMKDGEVVAILETLAKSGKDETKRVAQLSEKMRTTLTRNSPEKGKTP